MTETGEHDWDRQYEETNWVWNDLRSKGVDFAQAYKLDLQFVPRAAAADRNAFAEALRGCGYECSFYDDESTVEATTAPIVLTPESIWEHERRTTEIALQHGYLPDGWGFLEG
jgi:hypothetical protein